ncbi:hypothetical protein [Kribbella deserti]|uniref:DUF4352 domain-containing protein n=1 Tax=Kribbella deserti TaxID=1926257 RepID=A0ABV6QVY9_9ACTN
MRRTDKIAAAIGVTVSLIVSIGLWFVLRGGDALYVEGGSSNSMFAIKAGDDVYYPVKSIQNTSRQIITLVNVVPVDPDPGIEFVDAKVYDFFSATRTFKGQFRSPEDDPRRHLIGEVNGRQLVPNEALPDTVLVHLRITSDQRPLNIPAVKVTYRQYGRLHTQLIHDAVEIH